MKRALYLLISTLSTIQVWGQDFASKFMSEFTKDQILHCQTISPKMMDKLVDIPENDIDENNNEMPTSFLLSKLKSARIVTAESEGKKYFHQALQLIEKNKNRFTPLTESPSGKNNQIYVRKHNDIIIELIMLNLNDHEHLFTIVNFTGEMDDQFIKLLSKRTKKTN